MDLNTNLFSQLSQCLAQVEQVREELADMLYELSASALVYAYRPIMYAYYYSDGRDFDRLTDEDLDRFCLIEAAAHESAKEVAALADLERRYSRHGQK